MEIERSLLVCYGDGLVLRLQWRIEQEQGFVLSHSVSNSTPVP